jgi:hypothetical protein
LHELPQSLVLLRQKERVVPVRGRRDFVRRAWDQAEAFLP